MDIREELKSAGAYPVGPVSAWPQERNQRLVAQRGSTTPAVSQHATKVKARPMEMAKGLVSSAVTAARHGKVSSEVREERWNTCQKCPSLIKNSSRCAECGCMMKAKTWLNGDPKMLCPKQKWAR